MGWSAGAWAYRPCPLRTAAAGAPLAAGAFTTGQAATPGMHRAALRVPGGRPPRAGSHQRRDSVVCRTSPLVNLGRRHCACRGQGARSCLAGLAWAGVPCGGDAPPRPPQVATLRCRSNGLLLPGYVLPGTGGRRPMARACLGSLGAGRSSGAAPLACAWPLRFAVLGRARKVISARSCVKARAQARSPCVPHGSPP